LENQTADGSSETFIGTRDAVRLAQRSGIIVVGAAGNYSNELTHEKMDDTGSIIVGAILQNDSVPYWSNFGERITVAAYGEKLRTLSGPNGSFSDFGGTSGATPQVAATVALMKEVQPLLTPEQAREILIETRKTSAATVRVGGILSLPAAVERARTTPPDFAASNRQWLFRLQLVAILLNP
jgi:subtilisin family serine protease